MENVIIILSAILIVAMLATIIFILISNAKRVKNIKKHTHTNGKQVETEKIKTKKVETKKVPDHQSQIAINLAYYSEMFANSTQKSTQLNPT
jgi:hypothetical protein